MIKFLIWLNLFMAAINVINGLTNQRIDCLIVGILNLSTARLLDYGIKDKK